LRRVAVIGEGVPVAPQRLDQGVERTLRSQSEDGSQVEEARFRR
jgi:hypothetical protein